MSDRQFLEVEPNRSLFNVTEDPDFTYLGIRPPDFKGITPNPGFCVKVKTDDNEKVFINLCHCPEVPPPPPSLDVYKIIASESSDECLFRFPLSLGELHSELDKSGNVCKCYDVVINSDYYQEVSKNSNLRDFIMTLACSGLERKYDISLDVGTCIILNKPYHGKMPKHFIKLKSFENPGSAPLDKIIPDQEEIIPDQEEIIPELDEMIPDQVDVVMPVKNPLPFVSSTSPEILSYNLFQTPASGNPSRLIFQCLTKNVKDRKSVAIFVSQSKLTIRDTKCKPLISIGLPYSVVPEKTLSNFWKNRLCIVLPVESN